MPQYTPGLEKVYPVTVPADLLRTKYYDGDGEIFSMLGAPLIVEEQHIPAPSLGVWSLLETFNCPFVNKFNEALPMDAWRAMYINEYRAGHPWKWWRPNAVEEVRQWVTDEGPETFDVNDKKTWKPWDHKVYRYATKLKFDINYVGHYEDIRLWFELSFNGYEMIPKSAGGGSAYWFGAETLASMMAAIGACTNCTPHQLLWETPMCSVGHTAAQLIRINNPKASIARPKCPDHIKQMFEECIERAKLGQLHPWQKAEPTQYPLDQLQAYLNPDLPAHYRKMQKEAADRKQEETKANRKRERGL